MSSTKSFHSSLHQSPSLSQARYPGASTSANYSNSQPFMTTLSLSAAQNASPITPAFGNFIVMSSSMLSHELNEVKQTSPFVNNSSSVITDGLSLAPSVSHLDFKTTFFYGSVSTPVPALSMTRSLLSPIESSKSYNQPSLEIQQLVTKQASSGFNGTTISSNETSSGTSANFPSSYDLIGAAPTRKTSYGINATTISSNESSFTTSTNTNLNSSLDVISVTPNMTVSRSITFSILTFRATALSSLVQSMSDSSSASGADYDRKSSVISATLLRNVSINDSRSYSETDSRQAASPLTAVSSSLISSIGRTSFFATDPSPLQPTPMMSKRHTTFYSSYSLLSSYLLTETFSFAVSPGVESLLSLGTVTSSQGPPRTSCCVVQLSTAVMSHSSLLVHSMVPVSVTMHTPVNYFTSTDAQPPSTKSKLSSKFSTASASESTLAFSTIPHTTAGSKTSSQNGESTLAANGSATFTAVSSLANTSISSGLDHLSKKYSLSTIFNPVQSTSITLHQASSSLHIQSSNSGRY